MSKKKSFVLRLDPDMYAAIERWAADEFRSTNGQIEWILNRAMKEAGRITKTRSEVRREKTKEKE